MEERRKRREPLKQRNVGPGRKRTWLRSVVVLGEGSVLHEPVPNISSQAEGTLAHALAHGRQQRQDGREAGATRIEGERSKW